MWKWGVKGILAGGNNLRKGEGVGKHGNDILWEMVNHALGKTEAN